MAVDGDGEIKVNNTHTNIQTKEKVLTCRQGNNIKKTKNNYLIVCKLTGGKRVDGCEWRWEIKV